MAPDRAAAAAAASPASTASSTGSPTYGTEMAMSFDLKYERVAAILRRLPPLDRRRSRLVCRQWRDAVDSRAPARPGPAKTLVVAHGAGYVFDDVPGGSSREIPSPCPLADIVGTCNGLLCVVGTGGFVLSNPVTGEALHVPLPTRIGAPLRRWEHNEYYSFAHHPTTGLYKIVPFPVDDRWTGSFDAVQVYTLGEAASWRDVPAPAGSSRRKSCGLVSVDGFTYWVAMDTKKVMSLDLKDERIAAVITLPAPASEPGRQCRLTEAHGRLAVAAIVTQPTNTKTEVWVLEGGAGGRRWIRRYSVQLHGPDRQMVWPHFAHGDHAMTASTWQYSRSHELLYVHRLSGGKGLQCREARINGKSPGKAVGKYDRRTYRDLRTFAFVETTEPLNVYSGHGCRHIGKEISAG
uniref:F-box domain-containing protein n=1 Tax=Oryza glumipatula TaxID=40148 RepID=A0A0E0AX04_9ORYZ